MLLLGQPASTESHWAHWGAAFMVTTSVKTVVNIYLIKLDLFALSYNSEFVIVDLKKS